MGSVNSTKTDPVGAASDVALSGEVDRVLCCGGKAETRFSSACGKRSTVGVARVPTSTRITLGTSTGHELLNGLETRLMPDVRSVGVGKLGKNREMCTQVLVGADPARARFRPDKWVAHSPHTAHLH